jgi:ribosome-associated heat shock protein Hsp15
MSTSVRIDKWLWAVRVYKTRGLATDACKAGHVKIEGKSVKPAHAVRVGETITAYTGHHTRTVKVTGLIDKRVAGKVVTDFLDDQTPKEELERKTNASLRPISLVSKGKPSRKDRQAMDRIKEQL